MSICIKEGNALLESKTPTTSPPAPRPGIAGRRETILPFTTANPANYNSSQQRDDLNDSHALDKTSGAGRYGRWHAPGWLGYLRWHVSASVCGSMSPGRSWVHCGGRRQNILVMGSKAAISNEELRRRVRNRLDGRVTVDGFGSFADTLLDSPLPTRGVRPLFDAEAPEGGMFLA